MAFYGGSGSSNGGLIELQHDLPPQPITLLQYEV